MGKWLLSLLSLLCLGFAGCGGMTAQEKKCVETGSNGANTTDSALRECGAQVPPELSKGQNY